MHMPKYTYKNRHCAGCVPSLQISMILRCIPRVAGENNGGEDLPTGVVEP